ncbi:1-deoxy-D-xylulose 5-phosphate reductoisomerase [Iodidimonas nitroreducens]|uniref:1-deoxy-D-xylulose 5-phosphate reductoisomerase n=1 Tax=Iodidimonas nitroreducens TaxID=1236968 RepID=A0A5A7N7E5_9PROT|nr:1-deoxy-D-xylulose-5-phosphate reductoisomerase [Iodidimonas nitroreducens]GAK32798.1 1-deoxy-D-xylulose 5-phosphate reductoisomerase [alpha proteobacterium Q-1]GER02936.1 1-deoxy-D-xylulose 5-phosphate reductoisomerase [Iodidimonas nitroreducens]
MNEVRTITILGSTGSIGCNTLSLVEDNPQAWRVLALTAHSNVDLLAEQAKRVGAQLAVIADPAKFAALKDALAGSDVRAAAGPDALLEAAELPADWVMAAIVGAAGLKPTMKAIERGAIIGLANKECLVCAGDLVMKAVQTHGATLLPVDSEHNAIFQVFDFARPEGVSKIILTASGGPFRTHPLASLQDVTPQQAVKHPNWAMGAKISVDSASMMNKGLELIEAYHLFPLAEDRIEILIHPQSVIHSMVAFVDGSVLAQLGSPDMRTPIAYSLAWPARMKAPVKPLDLAEIARLDFEVPDLVRFPALRMARDALRAGGSSPTILNAANEIAVAAFLEKRIGFLDITSIVEECLSAMPSVDLGCLDDVYEIDSRARAQAASCVNALV